MKAKAAIKKMARAVGLDVRRYCPEADPWFRLVGGLKRFGIDLVFDIGANVGQFGSDLRSEGFGGTLVSFEPLAAAHEALIQRASHDPQWIVHPRTAIGDHDGHIKLNVARNSVSSSILPMLALHSKVAADSTYVGAETAPICRLDAVSPAYLEGGRRALLKIDTQGFEWQVLDGARSTLPLVHGVHCELTIAPLYEGQRLWKDLVARLEEAGFCLWSLDVGFVCPTDGRTLQLDGVFFRL